MTSIASSKRLSTEELYALDAAGESRQAWERVRGDSCGNDLIRLELRESLALRMGNERRVLTPKEREALGAPSQFLTALDRWVAGQHSSAILLLQRLMARHPGHILGRLHLAMFYMEAGESDKAESLLHPVMKGETNYGPACFYAGRIRMGKQDWEMALNFFGRTPRSVARTGELNWMMGTCYRCMHDRSAAFSHYASAASEHCEVGFFWYDWAELVASEKDHTEEALELLEKGDGVTGIRADYALGAAKSCRRFASPQYKATEGWLRKALGRGADEVSVTCELIYNSCRLFGNGKDPEALAEGLRLARCLHKRHPDSAAVKLAYGNLLFFYNRISHGLELLESAFQPGSRDWLPKSVYLFHSNYDEARSSEDLAAYHRAIGGEIEAAVTALAPDGLVLEKGEALRIGFVSPDLRNHPVGYFLDGVCDHFEATRIRCFFYASKVNDSELAMKFKAHPGWRNIRGVEDAVVARQIREDRIHVLVDLAGYTAEHRLPLFAMKPAPVQASWLGYPGTTGLTRIDYRIVDDLVEPEGEADERSTERIVRLADGFHAFRPPFPYPDIRPLPALREGVITFGCYNNLQKVNARVLAVWAAILQVVPNSRLLLKHDNLSIPANQGWIRESFRKLGVDTQRIHFKGRTDTLPKHVGCYNWLDITLDPFPYSGTTTTCDALYMGVPVICLEGDRHASRVSASFMRRLGLDDWVARDEAEYVQIAAAKAADLTNLSTLRTSLRQRFLDSPLGQPQALAQALEETFYAMWNAHAAGGGTLSAAHTPTNRSIS